MVTIEEQVALAPYTTLKVGGPGRYVAIVTSVAQLESAREFALAHSLSTLVLGSGSNVLVSDAGFNGLVIVNQIAGQAYVEQSDGTVLATFGAGEVFDDAVQQTVERGYWGLENLSHIPGTVGATPIQNVGAYGVEVSQLITAVSALSLTTGELRVFPQATCEFAYRDSYFKTAAGRDWVIVSVTYQLSTDPSTAVLSYQDLQDFVAHTDKFTARDIRDEVIRIRAGKFGDWHTIGTAGSFFKNPLITTAHAEQLVGQYPALPHFPQANGLVKVPLGWILDHICHLRGYTAGAVSLSDKQALVLLNTGDSAEAVIAFAAYVSDVVYSKTQITIEPEVRFV